MIIILISAVFCGSRFFGQGGVNHRGELTIENILMFYLEFHPPESFHKLTVLRGTEAEVVGRDGLRRDTIATM